MPAFNFMQRFVKKVESGEKTHTIRAMRKRRIRQGDMLHLYTGMRQKGCRLLMRVPCTRVEQIEINAKTSAMVSIDGVPLDLDEREALAKRDGFSGWDEMLEFWEGRLPFEGQIIHWRFASEGIQ